MSTRKIIEIDQGDVLRQRAHRVDKFDKKLRRLLDDMADTMYEADGLGLAAPQVGVSRRCVVIDVGEGLIELVNPTVEWAEGEVVDAEGCLSIPGRRCTVARPQRVRVRAQDRRGKWLELEGEDLLARCLCHEIDHLDGILYVDKMIEDVTDREEEEAAEAE